MYANRKDQMMDITVQLERGTQAICDSEQYRSYLDTMSRFHTYSASNCLLILMQKPEATLVAGYSTWKNTFGRNVRRGEKAIRILAPMILHEDPKDPSRNITRFRTASVFDISQTQGKPLPQYILNTVQGSVEQYDAFLKILQKIAPVPVSLEDTGSHAHGYYSPQEQRIVIAPDLPQVQTLKTLVHEIAHSMLHKDDEQTRNMREVQAESIAYVVMKHFGMDTSEYSFPYVALWSSTYERNELKASMEIIRRTADFLISEIEEAQNTMTIV